jgi:hypothetical protein
MFRQTPPRSQTRIGKTRCGSGRVAASPRHRIGEGPMRATTEDAIPAATAKERERRQAATHALRRVPTEPARPARPVRWRGAPLPCAQSFPVLLARFLIWATRNNHREKP